MGLFINYRVVRFLDGISTETVETAAGLLLAAFFKETNPTGVSYESSKGLGTEDAAKLVSRRLTALPAILDGGTGIAFHLEGVSEKDKWRLVFHRDVFPRIELETFVGEGRKLDSRGMEQLIKSGAGDLFQTSRLYGSAGDVYLSLKMSSLRQRRVHPLAPNGDLSAAVRFREICRQVWDKAHAADVPRWVSRWPWRVNSFVRGYDRLLLESAGQETLETALAQMGLNLALWFPDASQP
jgi:hypothetical protein